MRASLATLVAAVALIAAAAYSHPSAVGSAGPRDFGEAARALDGAYRDGLFVGHLHRTQGRKEHVVWGRWSTEADRRSFIAGYRQGYWGTTPR